MRVQDILRTKGAKLSAILPDVSIRNAASALEPVRCLPGHTARLRVFSLLIWPSACPLLHLSVTAFLAALRSRFSVRANCCMVGCEGGAVGKAVIFVPSRMRARPETGN